MEKFFILSQQLVGYFAYAYFIFEYSCTRLISCAIIFFYFWLLCSSKYMLAYTFQKKGIFFFTVLKTGFSFFFFHLKHKLFSFCPTFPFSYTSFIYKYIMCLNLELTRKAIVEIDSQKETCSYADMWFLTDRY